MKRRVNVELRNCNYAGEIRRVAFDVAERMIRTGAAVPVDTKPTVTVIEKVPAVAPVAIEAPATTVVAKPPRKSRDKRTKRKSGRG